MPEYQAVITLTAKDDTGSTFDSITKKLTGIGKSASQAMGSFGGAVSSAVGTAMGPLGMLKNAVSGIGSSFSTMLTGFGMGIGQAAFGLVSQGIGMAQNSIIGMNAELETSTLQFETLMGSSDKAAAHVQDLFTFAQKTPFESGPVIQASRTMETFGGAALDTMTNLTRFGDAAAATSNDIGEVAFWMSRAYANIQAGKPIGEATMRLSEMAVITPEVSNKIEAMQKAGAKSSEIWDTLSGSLGRFDGAMDKMSGTWAGLTSNLEDTIRLTAAKAFEPLFQVAKKAVGAINDLLGSDAFQQWAIDTATAISKTVTGIADVVGSFITMGQAIGEAFTGDPGAMGVVYDMIRKVFGDSVANFLQPFLQNLMDFIPTLRTVAGWFGNAFADLKSGDLHNMLIDVAIAINQLTGLDTSNFVTTIESITSALGSVFQAALQEASRLFSDLQPTFNMLADAATKLLPALTQLTPPLQGFHDVAADYTVVDALAGAINGLSTAIAGVVGALINAWTWLESNKVAQATLVGILAAVTAGLALYAIQMAVSTAATIAAGIPLALFTVQLYAAVAAQTALNLVMSLNPIAIIVVALVGLAAALVFAYNTCEPFRQAVDAAWAAVQTFASTLTDLLGPAIQQVGQWVSDNGDTIKTVLLSLLGPIGLVASAWINNWGDIQGKVQAFITIIQSLPTIVGNALGQVGSFFDTLGTKINGILAPVQALGSAIGGLGGGSGGSSPVGAASADMLAPADGGAADIGLQQGGWLREPVAGIGLDTGKSYALAESGPEYVVPAGASAGVGSGLNISGPISVTVSGAAGPAQAWADSADALFDELYARISRGLANRVTGDGRGAF